MALIISLLGCSVGGSVAFITEPVLGELAFIMGVVTGAAAAYATAALPGMELERSSLLQAREAPTLGAMGTVYLQGTGSRSRTVLMLRSEEPDLSAALDVMKRMTLLGFTAGESLGEVESAVRSESTLRILRSISLAESERLEDKGEEMESSFRSSVLGEETKFPVFLTVSFFLPIMLMIFAAIEHHTDPLAIASLAFLEIIVLDLALSVSSSERRRLSE